MRFLFFCKPNHYCPPRADWQGSPFSHVLCPTMIPIVSCTSNWAETIHRCKDEPPIFLPTIRISIFEKDIAILRSNKICFKFVTSAFSPRIFASRASILVLFKVAPWLDFIELMSNFLYITGRYIFSDRWKSKLPTTGKITELRRTHIFRDCDVQRELVLTWTNIASH